MSNKSEKQESQWHNDLKFTTGKKDGSSPSKIHELEKYQIIKLMASGDYVCNDQFGNNYLLVCQHSNGGLSEFKSAVKNNFRRNSTNRALLTPFEDIEHGGLKFTVYMLPANSVWLGQNASTKPKSEIYCLSLLYTLINKVLKPLLEIFAVNAQKWLHLENIWIKQSKIFYILNERKKQTSFKRTEQKYTNNLPESEVIAYEKMLLRKLCQILLPFFKADSELKSFLSIVMDAMLNQEFSITEICLLLSDRSKRRVFMDEKNQKQGDENSELFFVPFRRNDIWNKRKLIVPGPRRSLVNQTLNIQKLSQWQESTEYQKRELKNVGETIDIPPSFQTKKHSFSHSRMFDFRDRSKKRNSLSTDRSSKPNKFQKTISVSEAQKNLRTYIKKQNSNSKYCTISLSIQQKAYRKFHQRIQSERKSEARYQNFNIQQEDQKLRSYLLSQSLQKKKRASTIEIGSLRGYHRPHANENNYQTIAHEQIRQDPIPKKVDKEKHQIVQTEKLKELQRQKQIQKEKQRQRQKLIMFEKQKQLERERQMQKQLERLKMKQIQREKQIERLKQIQKQRERQRQKEKEREREREREKQQQKARQKQLEQQKQRLKKEQQIKLKKIESQKAIKNMPLNQMASGVNLDQIQIVSPQIKSVFDAKKKQEQQRERQKQKQRLEKINKPPLPAQGKKVQIKKPESMDDQLQQIVFTNNKKQSNEKDEKKGPPPQIINKPKQPQQEIQQKPAPKKQKEEAESQQRTKTVTSQIASSCGPKKPVSKQVAQYIHMINKMGEGVAKSSKISAKLEDVQWFTGIYFIYKRFLYQRKNIEKWLEARAPKLTRYHFQNNAEWEEWFNSEQKRVLHEKVKLENENIVSSIIKMNKKIMKKSLPGNFLFHAALSRHSQQQSKIAVSEVVKEFDLLQQKQKLKDDEILTHINELLNGLYIIAELDGKIPQKKPLIQVLKKKSPEQLSEFSDFIYDLYIKD